MAQGLLCHLTGDGIGGACKGIGHTTTVAQLQCNAIATVNAHLRKSVNGDSQTKICSKLGVWTPCSSDQPNRRVCNINLVARGHNGANACLEGALCRFNRDCLGLVARAAPRRQHQNQAPDRSHAPHGSRWPRSSQLSTCAGALGCESGNFGVSTLAERGRE